jgi:nucleoside-diphosphate-sugar epimerase
MRVLVTGAGGFVGGFVAARLAHEGHRVAGFDRVARPLDQRHRARDVEVHEGDLLDAARVRGVVERAQPDGIVHAAALISQVDGTADPLRTYRVNVEGTMNVLEAARAFPCRLVYVSTATLYGIHPDLHPLAEDARPEPVGIYDTTKLMAETMVLTYAKVYGLDTVAVRPGYVYGPGASTGGYFLDKLWAGEAVEQPTGGDLPMDVTYVRDLADGIYRALTVRPLAYRLFNVTGGVLRTRREVAEIAARLVPGARVSLGPGVAANAHLRGPSRLDRARAQLGYEPGFTLEQGMADWLTWLREGEPARS